jgi:hypothetical protein
MGELSPKVMYQLLSQEWKVGPNLAVGMIDCFGGNVLDHMNALLKLAMMKENFSPQDVYDMCYSMMIGSTINRFNATGEEERMRDCLSSLAKHGSVGIPPTVFEDSVCCTICGNNIGAVVKRGSLVVGLPERTWEGTVPLFFLSSLLSSCFLGDLKFGLLPTKQSMRLILAGSAELPKNSKK